MQSPTLRHTRWLAQRLALSVTTVERLRAAGSTDIPPAIVIGRSIRYDEAAVERWLQERIAPGRSAIQHGGGCHAA